MHVIEYSLDVIGRQKGQGMVEYALVIAFVVAIAVVLFTTRPELSHSISGVMENASSTLKDF